MRLLYLSVEFPRPVNNGLRMRIWSILTGLAAEGHETTLLSFTSDKDSVVELPALKEICKRVEIVPLALRSLSASGDYFVRLRAVLEGASYAAQRFASPAMQKLISKYLVEEAPEAIICDTVFSTVNLPVAEVPIFINNHNVEHLIVERYAEFERNPFVRIYAGMEARRMRKWEKGVCERASVCMVCSENDRQLLAALAPGTQVAIVPNVVDTDRYSATPAAASNIVLFQGGMDWFPNRDGLQYFLTEIFPLIRHKLPDAEFIAAGRNPSPELVARFSVIPGVTFTGTVPDIRPYLEQAGVCVVPLRVGGGTRLKILEAAAAGKAIVSTRLGAEGLEFAEGQDIVLADDPRSFAEQVIGLLENPVRRKTMGEAANRRVRERYSYDTLRKSLRLAFSMASKPASATAQEDKVTALLN